VINFNGVLKLHKINQSLYLHGHFCTVRVVMQLPTIREMERNKRLYRHHHSHINRGLLVASRGHFSDKDCVSVASQAAEVQCISRVPRSV
jgi:hypothetical protein